MSNKIEALNLEDYDISEEKGFLSSDLAAVKLSNPYYSQWEEIATKIPLLILTSQLKPAIENELQLLKIDQLITSSDLKRGYVLLTFIINGYVWSSNPPNEVIPDALAYPLLEISSKLGLPPVVTYSSVVLWNYRTIDETKSLDMQNLTTDLSFTGSFDEAWFYLISVYFEKVGAQAIKYGLRAIDSVNQNNSELFIENMKALAESISQLTAVLNRIEEKCDPYVFYFRIRPFLAGWKNMEKVGLPSGVKYGYNGEYQQWAGGSNAQSSLIQYLDLVLGVTHFNSEGKQQFSKNTISNEGQYKRNAYLLNMQNYMPQLHRKFLQDVNNISNIRQYVISQNKDSNIKLAYDTCIAMLKLFRDYHLTIIKKYILTPANAEKIHDTTVLRNGLANTHNAKNHIGTGGTSLVNFLSQCRDETSDMAVTKWVRQALKNKTPNNSNLEMNLLFDYNYNFIGFKDKNSNVQLADDEHSDVDFFVHHW